MGTFPLWKRLRVAALLCVSLVFCLRQGYGEWGAGDIGMGILHWTAAVMAWALLVRIAGPKLGGWCPGGIHLTELVNGAEGIGLLEATSLATLGVLALLGSHIYMHLLGLACFVEGVGIGVHATLAARTPPEPPPITNKSNL